MCKDENVRIVIKQGSGVPTVPVSADHRNGDWIATDIYEGEQYQDTDTGVVYTRSSAGIEAVGGGGGAIQPKVWKAQIDQTGTSAPTLVELVNTLGVTPSRTTYSSVGNYTILGLGSIFTGLIHIAVDIYDFTRGDVTASYGIAPGNVLQLRSYQGGVLTDGLFNNAGGAIGSSVITITKYD